jgi:hypothetical protein
MTLFPRVEAPTREDHLMAIPEYAALRARVTELEAKVTDVTSATPSVSSTLPSVDLVQDHLDP